MDIPALLRIGWPPERVELEWQRAAQASIEDGYSFAEPDRESADEVQRIVSHSVMDNPDWQRSQDDGTIVVYAPDERVAGGLILSAWEAEGYGLVATLRTVAIEPEHRGRGLGLVLLAMIAPYIVRHTGQPPAFVHGACEPASAKFYQRAGFTVLQPGEPLPLVDTLFVNSNPRYTCHFVRNW